MNASDLLFAKGQETDRDDIDSVIEGLFIIDYGTIKAMRGTTACDVKHIIQRVSLDGSFFDETVTENVEILWPSAASFSSQYALAVGDRVLLVGMKHYLDTVNVKSTKQQEIFGAYTQESMKAIPLCVFNTSATMTIKVDSSGLMELKNQVESLKTLIDALFDTLATMSGTNAVNGSPIYPAGAVPVTGTWAVLKSRYASIFK
jgi:hypothetical protein